MSADDRAMPRDYPSLLAEVKERIRSAQYDALRAVNKELVTLYWDLGRVICKRQADGTSWGKAVVERLAADLRAEFPGMQGFSAQNLWYMRQFYLAYHGQGKLQPLVGEISWAKHLVILGKCKDILEREFESSSAYPKSLRGNCRGQKRSLSFWKTGDEVTIHETRLPRREFKRRRGHAVLGPSQLGGFTPASTMSYQGGPSPPPVS